MFSRFLIIIFFWIQIIYGQCFDTEITEADFPYNHLADLTLQDDDWNQTFFPYDESNGHTNNANGNDHTYKLTLSNPTNIYITTCDAQTDVDVQIAIYTVDCDSSSWILFQDDSNSPIYYPDQTNETYQFECISGFETDPYYANMLPRLELNAGVYYVVVDDRAGGSGSVRTWFGNSLIVDSTSTAADFSNINYYFSEGVFGGDYTDVYNGNGIALEPEDYSLQFTPNGGNANDASIISLTTIQGEAILPGIEAVQVNIDIFGTPSGSEMMTIGPASVSSIFNGIGIPLLDIDGISFSVPDALSPSIISSNPFNGQENISKDSNIEIVFSEPIRHQDNSPVSNSNALDCFLLVNEENGESINYSLLTEDDISFSILPDGLLPDYSYISLSVLPLIEDQNNNSFEAEVIEFQTADETPPNANSIVFDDSLFLEFTEAIYMPLTNQVATSSDLAQMISLRMGDSTGIDIPFTIELEGNPPILSINPVNQYPSEATIFFSFIGDLQDIHGNSIEINLQGTFTISDYIPPSVDSYVLSIDNSFVDLFFDDEIYVNDDATGIINASDIITFIEPNGSNVDSCFVTSITKIDGNFLSEGGGDSNFRIHIEYNGTPDGNEYLSLAIADGITLYDDEGNQYPQISLTSEIPLFDILPPSIDSISVQIDSLIVLMESTPITFNFNEKVDSIFFTISSKVMDSVHFTSTLSDSSLDIILKPPFASYDSISIEFSYLEDISGLTTVDIAYTYRTPILGDYDLDGQITYNDMWDLVENWELKNYNYELGPYEGTAPHLISYPDSRFTIDDGMAFIQIWSWYQKNFGEIVEDSVSFGNFVNILQSNKFLLIPINDSTLCGQIQFVYDSGNVPPSFKLPTSRKNQLYLNSHFPEKGYSIIEFARSGLLKNDTIKIDINSLTQGKFFYTFKNQNQIQKGEYVINQIPLPEKLSLYPVYPNPFNPVATFKFDIPSSFEGSQKVLLTIYDVKGRIVDTLLKKELMPGTHKVKWYAKHRASGMYFAQLRYGDLIQNQKVIFLK